MAASLPMEKDPKQALEVYRQWKDQGTNESCSIGQLITQRRSAVIYEDFIPICQDLLDFCQLCYKSLTDDCQINSSYYQPRVNKIIQLIEELYRIMLNLCQVEQAILQIQQENSAAAIDLQAVALLKDHKDTDSVPWGIIDEIYHHEIAGKTISLAASTLPPLIDTVSQELSKDVVKKIIETIQRLTWKMEAAVECENGDSPVIHSIIFTPVRQQQLDWAMLPEPSCGSSRQSGLRSSFHLSLPYPTDDISGKGDILTSQPPLLDPNHVANTDGLPDPANLSITSDEKSSNHSKQDTTIQPPSVAIADRSTIVNHDDDDRNRSTDQNETFSDSHQEQIRSCHDVPSATRLQGNNEDLSAHILPCNININKKKSLDKVIDTKELKLPPESEVADPPLSPICHPRIPSIILMKQSSSLDVVQSVSGNGKVSNEFNITSDDIDSNSPTYIHNRTCSFDSVHANHVLTLARDNSMSKVMENNNKLTYRKIGREKYLTLRPLSDVRSSAVMTQEDLTKLGLKVDLLGQVDSQSIDNEINKTTTTLDINTSTVFRQSCADMVQLFSSRKQLSRVNDDVEPPTMKRMSYHSSQELTIPLIIHKDSIESQKEEEKEEEKSQDKEGKKNLQLEISQPQSEESKLPAVDQDMGESPKQLSVSLSDNTDKLIASISQIQENLQVLKQDTPLQLSVTPISVRSMGNFSNILQRALPKKVGQSVFKHRFIVYEIKVTTILPGDRLLQQNGINSIVPFNIQWMELKLCYKQHLFAVVMDVIRHRRQFVGF
ncbi:hypothetical protein TrispH2_009514 [Trichoplax sp. H2]|nr:hypothetical protein TrispH2_009514 [Trichoplax sp. H2]|eukprot:RDD38619.1 hypothetical protein TrispH2_009514 [Trichoplax sp. H2]